MSAYQTDLDTLFTESRSLEAKIKKQLERLKYE